VAIDAIKQLKARYFRLLDLKRWSEYRRLFTDDCVFDRTATDAGGPDAFVDRLQELLSEVDTVHHGHTPELEIIGPDRARGIWAMVDYLHWAPDANVASFMRVEPRQTGLMGYGHYEEEYRRERGSWKISLFRVTRLTVVPLVEESIALRSVWPTATLDWLPAG
jgi:hypothetical protein